MVDGIFNDGLQGDLVAVVIQAPRVHVKFIGELVFVAVLLDLEIALGVLDLLGDGDELVAAADADAEQPCQGVHHIHRVGVPPPLAHPGDGVQGIIQKMGVDLGLEGLQLSLAQVDLLLAHGGHELLNPQHHVPEGLGELPDLPGAPHRAVGKVVGVPLKALHGGGQPPQGTAQHPGQNPAGQQGSRQHQTRQAGGDPDHLPHAAVDQLVHKADAHHPPAAVLHAGDGVDHGILHIGAVLQGGQGRGVLRLQPRIQQLLLGVVHNVPHAVHQKAVAPLADANIVDVVGDIGEAQIQGHPGGLAPLFQRCGHGDHPGVVALKDGLHMGGAHIGAVGGPGRIQVKGEILEDLLPGFPAQRPALHQLPRLRVAGNGHHIGPEL